MGRRWTLEAAETMLGEVRQRTEQTVTAVDVLEARASTANPDERAALAEETRGHLSRWVREMEALGVDVLGPWAVEFRFEEGAFCWAWPEGRLTFRSQDAAEATSIQ